MTVRTMVAGRAATMLIGQFSGRGPIRKSRFDLIIPVRDELDPDAHIVVRLSPADMERLVLLVREQVGVQLVTSDHPPRPLKLHPEA